MKRLQTLCAIVLIIAALFASFASAHDYDDIVHHVWTLRVGNQDLNFADVRTSRSEAKQDRWSSWTEVDEFTGERVVSSVSPVVYGDPYGYALFGVHCVDGEVKARVVIDYLNPTNTGWAGGRKYARVDVVVSADGLPKSRGQSKWGVGSDGRSLYSDAFDNSVLLLMVANELAFRIPYYRHGNAEIRFDLTGARPHLGGVLKACKMDQRTKRGLRHFAKHKKRS